MDTAKITPLRLQAADALRRARRLPIGPARNDLRRLAIGLRYLDKRGVDPKIGIVLAFQEQEGLWFPNSRA